VLRVALQHGRMVGRGGPLLSPLSFLAEMATKVIHIQMPPNRLLPLRPVRAKRSFPPLAAPLLTRLVPAVIYPLRNVTARQYSSRNLTPSNLMLTWLPLSWQNIA